MGLRTAGRAREPVSSAAVAREPRGLARFLVAPTIRDHVNRRQNLLPALELAAIGLAALVVSWPWIKFVVAFGMNAGDMGDGADSMLYGYMLKVECLKLTGVDTSGFFDGGFFFPKHQSSLLYTEPTWATSVVVLPLWLWLEDPFKVIGLAAPLFLCAGWITTYWFLRKLDCSRVGAFFGTASLGLSAAWFGVMPRPFFWPFWLVPLAGGLLIDVVRRSGWIRAAVLGTVVAWLAWSSAHLTVMGGTFLAALFAWLATTHGITRDAWRRIALVAVIASIGMATAFIPLMLALRSVGSHRDLTMQAGSVANVDAVIACRWSATAQWLLGDARMSRVEAETIPGLVPLAALVAGAGAATLAILAARSKHDPAVANPAQRWKPRAVGAVAGAAILGIAWLSLGRTIDGVTLDWTAAFTCWASILLLVLASWGRIRRVWREPAVMFLGLGALTLAMTFGPLWSATRPARASPLLPLLRAPGFEGIRAVARWGVMAAFGVGGSAACVLSRFRAGPWRVVPWIAVAALLFDCVTAEHFRLAAPPIRSQAIEARLVDLFLKQVPGEGAVVELPLRLDRPAIAMRRVYSRFFHGRPTVNGWAGVHPDFVDVYMRAAEVSLIRDGRLDPASISAVRHLGARFWVIHLDEMDTVARDGWPESLGDLRRVATSPDGKTLVYEDPSPRVDVP